MPVPRGAGAAIRAGCEARSRRWGSKVPCRPAKTAQPNLWNVDIVHARLSNGLRDKMLTVLDESTRQNRPRRSQPGWLPAMCWRSLSGSSRATANPKVLAH